MSTVQPQQSSIAASGVGTPPSLWRRVITPTGAPPAWGLVRYLAAGIVATLHHSTVHPVSPPTASCAGNPDPKRD